MKQNQTSKSSSRTRKSSWPKILSRTLDSGNSQWRIDVKVDKDTRIYESFNANADVETVHSTIEGEFFDAQAFASRGDFFAKINTYQLWYNVARKNSSRGWHSPLE